MIHPKPCDNQPTNKAQVVITNFFATKTEPTRAKLETEIQQKI